MKFPAVHRNSVVAVHDGASPGLERPATPARYHSCFKSSPLKAARCSAIEFAECSREFACLNVFKRAHGVLDGLARFSGGITRG